MRTMPELLWRCLGPSAAQVISSAVLRWRWCLQPLDGAACVMDGSLLGASETSYVSRAMIINSLINLGLLLLVTRKLSCSLGSIWFTLKLMTVGRIISSLLRFRSGKGPLGRVAEQVV